MNYSDGVARDVFARGLVDQENQLDFLGDQNPNMSHKEVVKCVESSEAGKQSANQLLQSLSAEAPRSQN